MTATASKQKRGRGRPKKTDAAKKAELTLWVRRCQLEGWRLPRLNHAGWIPDWTLSRLKKRWAAAYSEE